MGERHDEGRKLPITVMPNGVDQPQEGQATRARTIAAAPGERHVWNVT